MTLPDHGERERQQEQERERERDREREREQVPQGAENACELPADRGTCGGRLEAYYFEKAMGQCLRFEYTGCGGNANRFSKLEQCEAKCGRRTGSPVGMYASIVDFYIFG